MSFWSGPPQTPPLETHFFEVLREVGGGGGGVKNVEKMTPPFFGSKIMNLLVFFDFEPKNHLAEVVRSKPGRRIYGENATYPPILAFLGLFAYPTPRG